jgi:hypothetical protein
VECREPIVGRYLPNRFWKTNLCASCVDGQVCAWCNQFGGCKPVNGVDICRECRRHVIDTQEELEDLKVEALRIITLHIGPNNLDQIPVRLKNEAGYGEVPKCLGLAASREELTLLLLESGIPDSFALAVLCHEFGHAMLFRNHQTLEMRASAGTHADVVEEGFCQVLNAIALQTRTDPVARFQSFLMPASPDPVYGEGFRLMWRAAQEVGSVAALLEVVSGDPLPFRGPNIGAVVEESLDDDDLVAVVDAGCGDPTKGPLRGTALKPEEAPAETPRGPRLRGTALAVAADRKREEKEIKKGGLRGTGLALARVKEEEKKVGRKESTELEDKPKSPTSRLRGTSVK